MTRLELVCSDITEQAVDAIVNAANAALAGGGGVDGAIHRRGGPAIMDECQRLGGCPTGDARATTAGDLPARFVVHAVGPRWRGGGSGEPDLLASCHRRAVEVADGLACRSIAFPAISTGIYGYPVDRAAPVALAAAWAAAQRSAGVDLVRFVLFSDADLAAFREAAAALGLDESGAP
jgi:O-acetyl-ADP-ribose deacetylase (regulator of RNase III)